MVEWSPHFKVDLESAHVVLEGRADYGGVYGPPVSAPEQRVAVVRGKSRRIAPTLGALATELDAAHALPVVFTDDEDAWWFAVIVCELRGIGEPIRTPSLSIVWGDWFGIDVVEEQVRVEEGVMRFAAVDTGFDRTTRGWRVVVNLATLDVEVEELAPTVR